MADEPDNLTLRLLRELHTGQDAMRETISELVVRMGRVESGLADANAQEFEALVADRRGDVLLAQGKPEDAKAAYTKAWQTMDPKVEYRRLIDAKLTALGAAPPAETPKIAGTAP